MAFTNPDTHHMTTTHWRLNKQGWLWYKPFQSIFWNEIFMFWFLFLYLLDEDKCSFHTVFGDTYWDNNPISKLLMIKIAYMIIPLVLRAELRQCHDDIIKRKHFPHYWPFVRGIHRSPVNSPHKGQWRGAWMFSLICVWTNNGVNNRDASDLRCHHTHYNITLNAMANAALGPDSISRFHLTNTGNFILEVSQSVIWSSYLYNGVICIYR